MIIQLFVLLIVGCLLWWAATKILAAFGIGDPVATVVQVAIVFLFVFALLDMFGYLNLGVVPRLR